MAELGDRSVAEDDAFDNDAVGGIAGSHENPFSFTIST